MNYTDFLHSKMVLAPQSGFDIDASQINPALLPHQRDAVQWACKGGCRALFESFGLGKTVQELEWCRLVTEDAGGWALIVLPLGVRQEFARDAITVLGWAAAPRYVRTMAEVNACAGQAEPADIRIMMTNYERVRDGDIRPEWFTATALDEASVLRSFGSKTYQTFLPKFRKVPYRLVSTATPSPNRYKELIHYAGYLGVMDTGQALTRFFQRNSQKANDLTIYPHKEEEFWLWVSTWALFIQKPSDLGYSDEGYALPPMDIRYHQMIASTGEVPVDRDGQVMLYRDAALGLSDAAREKRISIEMRVAKAREIVESDPQAHFLLWHDLEDERRAIKQALPEAVEVYGSLDMDLREERIIAFSEGQCRLLATKKEISGSGCNFQRHCHRAIFLGIDYEFNDFIQAIHRIYRFLQTEQVIIDIIYMDTEQEILRTLLEKWDNHNRMQERMAEILRTYGMNAREAEKRMERSIGTNRMEVTGRHYKAVLNDCILETAAMPDDSVDLIVTSIPFSNHYEYTPSYNDLGHNEDTDRFFQQMDFLAPNLLRVLKPGRIFACHTKDRVLFGSQTGTGMPSIEPFHALTIQHYMRHGFQFIGMITVVTDVVRENNQTYRLGWTECCKDGSKMGVGCPEYVLLFRKLPSSRDKAYADVPVEKSKEDYTRAQWQIDAHAFWRSSGDRLMTKEELLHIPTGKLQGAYLKHTRATVYDYAEHVALAKELDAEGRLPATFMTVAPGSWQMDVWDDILRMRTLNSEQVRNGHQMHVCPLQIDIVDRLINRYSNLGETVYDPFGGLMTVPVRAVELGRNGIGCELNADYFRDGVGYCEEADSKRGVPTLFDLIETPEGALQGGGKV
jgi:DNA modification methylase